MFLPHSPQTSSATGFNVGDSMRSPAIVLSKSHYSCSNRTSSGMIDLWNLTSDNHGFVMLWCYRLVKTSSKLIRILSTLIRQWSMQPTCSSLFTGLLSLKHSTPAIFCWTLNCSSMLLWVLSWYPLWYFRKEQRSWDHSTIPGGSGAGLETFSNLPSSFSFAIATSFL